MSCGYVLELYRYVPHNMKKYEKNHSCYVMLEKAFYNQACSIWRFHSSLLHIDVLYDKIKDLSKGSVSWLEFTVI